MYVLEQAIKRDQFPKEQEKKYLDFIKSELAPRYAEFIGNEVQKAYLESYHDYGQNLFDRYISYADAWIEEQDFKDPDTGQIFDREILDQELSKIEKPAGVANPKDFRNEVVKFALRARALEEEAADEIALGDHGVQGAGDIGERMIGGDEARLDMLVRAAALVGGEMG